MSDFTPKEFNLAMAIMEHPDCSYRAPIHGSDAFYLDYDDVLIQFFNPHHDLNQLMPIAWKYEIELTRWEDDESIADGWCAEDFGCRYICSEHDPVEAIRQCLWQIYKEQT